MANLQAIRKRISSVKNTQQITKAMKMVAAAKLKKAQDMLTGALPYLNKFEQVVQEIRQGCAPEDHPFLKAKPVKKLCLIVCASDRGLCGSFNSNMMKYLDSYIRQQNSKGVEEIILYPVGNKINDYVKKQQQEILDSLVQVDFRESFKLAEGVLGRVVPRFIEGQFDAARIIYYHYISTGKQQIQEEDFLPIQPSGAEEGKEDSAETAEEMELQVDAVFEPGKVALLPQILKMYIHNKLYRVLMESATSEFIARMNAMELATKNAGEMIDHLTLVFNKARQAAITKELLEIITGAEARKG